jgi:hypothetical protein
MVQGPPALQQSIDLTLSQHKGVRACSLASTVRGSVRVALAGRQVVTRIAVFFILGSLAACAALVVIYVALYRPLLAHIDTQTTDCRCAARRGRPRAVASRGCRGVLTPACGPQEPVPEPFGRGAGLDSAHQDCRCGAA